MVRIPKHLPQDGGGNTPALRVNIFANMLVKICQRKRLLLEAIVAEHAVSDDFCADCQKELEQLRSQETNNLLDSPSGQSRPDMMSERQFEIHCLDQARRVVVAKLSKALLQEERGYGSKSKSKRVPRGTNNLSFPRKKGH